MVLIQSYIIFLVIFFFKFTLCAQPQNELILQLQNSPDSSRNIINIDANLKQSIDVLLNQDEIEEDIQIMLYFRAKSMIDLLRTETQSEIEEKRLNMIFEKSEDFDLADYDFDDLQEEYESILSKKIKKRFYGRPYIYLSYLTWNYSLKLSESSGEKANLYSKEKGPCFGGGYRYSNAYWGLAIDGCYAYMRATVGEDSKTIKYNQSNVAVDAIFIKAGAFWFPRSRISIGLFPVISFHYGKYTPPSGGRISEDSQLSYGYLIDSSWSWDKINLHLGIGSINNYPSSLWQLGASYIF